MKTALMKKISDSARVIRAGLAMVIPVLFIGSVMVLLNGFPLMAYQSFLDSFMCGAIRGIIGMIQTATVGVLALHLTIALNYSYMNRHSEGNRPAVRLGSLLGCLTGFVILVGLFSGEPDLSLLSGQGVFSALVAAMVGSSLFRRFETALNSRKMLLVEGAENEFNAALHIVLPYIGVVLCFAVADRLVTQAFAVESVQDLFQKVMSLVFHRMYRSYCTGLLFTTLTCLMWWFGIHGNNVLNQIAEDMFTTIIPGQIVSKSFIDTFVNMGGTGCMLGFLMAMMIFGKRSSTKKLTKIAFLPGLFNISELFVFGFPVIYNPYMFIPFILAPILCYSNAYMLTYMGFLPPVTSEVIWTTPALMSGFLATGSPRGIIVQLMNIIISAACYTPFLIKYEKKSSDEFSGEMDNLLDILKRSEETEEDVALTECEGNAGRLARLMATDLESALALSSSGRTDNEAESRLFVGSEKIFDGEGKCTGARASLRWEHKSYGSVPLPLVLKIASESGNLFDLETYFIGEAVRASSDLRKSEGEDFCMRIPVMVKTLFDKRFVEFLRALADECMLRGGNICLETDGGTGLLLTREAEKTLDKIRALGYVFSMDETGGEHE